MNISLAELVRLSLGSYYTQMGSPSGSESESLLKLKLEASNETKDRADQIIIPSVLVVVYGFKMGLK